VVRFDAVRPAPNPLSSRSFNIGDTFSEFPLLITLAIEDKDSIAITINYSGFRTGKYETGSSTYTIDYNYQLNAAVGRCALFVEWKDTIDEKTVARSFSVVLDFNSLTGGTYPFLGDVGLEASDAVTQVSNFGGTFMIEQLK